MAVSKEQIAAAAIRHLNVAPASSMEQIAQAAGISRATLHRHFATRDELIIELGWRAHAAWMRVQEEAGLGQALGAGDPEALGKTLHALLLGHIDVAEEHGFVFTEHLIATDPDLVRRSDELEDREVALVAACQQAGILRADLPARWITSALYGLLMSGRESLRRGDIARRELPRLLSDTFLKGTSR